MRKLTQEQRIYFSSSISGKEQIADQEKVQSKVQSKVSAARKKVLDFMDDNHIMDFLNKNDHENSKYWDSLLS